MHTPRPRFMWITPGRIFYAGLLGRPSMRRLGGWMLYFSDAEPMGLSLGPRAEAAGAPSGRLAIVPPYQSHRIASSARHIADLILEPEHLDVARLAPPLGELLRRGAGLYDDDDPLAASLRRRLVDARERLAAGTRERPPDDAAFDETVFGSVLARPALDPRVQRALQAIDAEFAATVPARDRSGVELAEAAGLSLSRFVRLFASEVGVPLRTFRGWKRARSVLQRVTQPARLTDIALETGYPDSAHFSRSIRQTFGLQPREVMAGSRRVALLAGRGRDGR